ncbi:MULTISPECIES: hypothetical protein [unclassified Mesorhizobium]|uniref:hypothetical protein n=1 Tax=unclassified Mesorhizobium TaxID=325217 RepID=UPI000F75ACBF|nr:MULTISPECIES: hypothetical protein [unclassified Mesorhizobium]TGT59589.1 hypothetical protein EN813_028770 [Mesorhizobium sp. M00.F.Ca.ET.170.01.1.1]AZO12595.1 hypothetical protein EJ074_28325 [Mesorhizobium sp. M3A.F.Ca.ET.080.04.2.1]RWB71427.1 MAG: hypothetical protein EOQ49_16105 [Mesorhizobium sp.]RWB91066.1 MAG: hypothetical protein EOQ52_06425 [Mesorhizobium sp.]RWE25188.1 MAG: hypothetical protein EOS77_29305 [Mesorhizobium sp.]
MQLSMWTYPWDIQDLGQETVERDIAQRAGLNMISLATSYHAGRFLQPRSPRRKAYFPEDGTIYFKPTATRWADLAIQPKVADVISEGGDVLDALVRRRDAGGPAISCWTVCLHNTRLGMRHPEAVTRNAFGDANYYNLCPSHPHARAYVRALVADISHSYRPNRIELESPSFMGFAHEYHHEKDGVGLTPEEDFLLSLCFCPSCLERAAKAGANGEAARKLVRQWIAETCERAVPERRFPDFPAGGLDLFRPWPELHAYLLWRFEPVTSLVAELREATHPATKVVIIDLKEGWLGGCDLAALGKVCDGAILCAYDMQADGVAELMAAGRAALGAEKFLGTGYRLFYPEMPGPEVLAAKVKPARTPGADGINFYNYGLVPAARLDWVKAAVST